MAGVAMTVPDVAVLIQPEKNLAHLADEPSSTPAADLFSTSRLVAAQEKKARDELKFHCDPLFRRFGVKMATLGSY